MAGMDSIKQRVDLCTHGGIIQPALDCALALADNLVDLGNFLVVVTAAGAFVVVDSALASRRGAGSRERFVPAGVAVVLAEAIRHVVIVGVSIKKSGMFSIGVGAGAEKVGGVVFGGLMARMEDIVVSRIATAAECLFKMEKVHSRIIEYLIRVRTAAAAVRYPSATAWRVISPLASKNRFNVADGIRANDLRDHAAVRVVVTAASTCVVVDSAIPADLVDNLEVRNTGVALKLTKALSHVAIVGVS